MNPDQGDLFKVRGRKDALDMDLIRVEKNLMKVPMLFVMNGDNRIRTHTEKTPEGSLTLRYVPMGAHEARVLCALMGMLQGNYRGVAPLSYSSDDDSPEAQAVWKELGEHSRAAGGFVSFMRTSRRQVAEVARGRKSVGGDDLNRVMESLLRLQSVIIHYQSDDGRSEYSMNLLSGFAREDDKLTIVLNPRMVKAINQRVPGLFSILSLHAGAQIKQEATDLLYRHLSVVMDQGATLAFLESTLISYLWIEDSQSDAERADERRRQSLRKALKELTTITPPWTVEVQQSVSGEPKYVITRPTANATRLATMTAAGKKKGSPSIPKGPVIKAMK